MFSADPFRLTSSINTFAAPYAHTNVHAKYWNRWKDPDVQRNVRIILNSGYTGLFALEYEEGPWDGVEGVKYLYQQVLAAL